MMHLSRRLIISSLLLVAGCLVIGLWSLRSGVVTLETQQIIAALLGDAPRSITLVVTEWRLPRVLMALLIGAALGVSGAIFQSGAVDAVIFEVSWVARVRKKEYCADITHTKIAKMVAKPLP